MIDVHYADGYHFQIDEHGIEIRLGVIREETDDEGKVERVFQVQNRVVMSPKVFAMFATSTVQASAAWDNSFNKVIQLPTNRPQ